MSWLSDAWDDVTDTAVGWAADTFGLSQDTRYGITSWLQGPGLQQAASWGLGALQKTVGGGFSGAPGAQAQFQKIAGVQSQMQKLAPALQQYAAQRRLPYPLVFTKVQNYLMAKATARSGPEFEGVLRSGAPPGFSQTPTSAAGNAVDDVRRLMGLSTGPSQQQRVLNLIALQRGR